MIATREYPCPFGGVGFSVVYFIRLHPMTTPTYPTTVHVSTTSDTWGLAADLSRALQVSLRLAEICPDARNWTWLEAECIHPETERHVPVGIVIVPSGYKALVNRLMAKLPVRRYDMSMIQTEVA